LDVIHRARLPRQLPDHRRAGGADLPGVRRPLRGAPVLARGPSRPLPLAAADGHRGI